MRDDFTEPYRPDPEAAEELLALGRTGRARKQGRSFAPSVLARPLAGSVGRPVRDENEEGHDGLRS
jgi:hypothetical protein